MILSENGGANGMIGVKQPKPGYVHAPNLKACPGTPIAEAPQPTTPKPTGFCRQVVQAEGLVVRQEPSSAATIVGSLAPNQKVNLADPIASRQLDNGRIWVKLATPITGWVANGFVNQSFTNLGPCQ
ncbi:MAG: SH3 domain-containing protein [Alkalinema sp. RL_2_19]|nr:SH3 domain-containing protein [Alkalinema sp. RL_2_19]